VIENLGAGWIRFSCEERTDSKVHLVGDFNGWDEASHPMERQENGTHEAILKLSPGEYEFKYKCGCAWFNERGADKYVPNCWGSENSVVVVAAYREDDAGEIGLPRTMVKPPKQRRLQAQPEG
jgi:1,4-alpha-glucan branching enzyme